MSPHCRALVRGGRNSRPCAKPLVIDECVPFVILCGVNGRQATPSASRAQLRRMEQRHAGPRRPPSAQPPSNSSTCGQAVWRRRSCAAVRSGSGRRSSTISIGSCAETDVLLADTAGSPHSQCPMKTEKVKRVLQRWNHAPPKCGCALCQPGQNALSQACISRGAA